MKTKDLQCSKHQCCRDMLVRDIEALENERDQLAASVEQAYMRGQIDCGVDPSFSDAKAYAQSIRQAQEGE